MGWNIFGGGKDKEEEQKTGQASVARRIGADITEWEQIRDLLSHKLSIIESKTLAASTWMEDNEKKITKGYDSLVKALQAGDAGAFEKTVSELGDAAGPTLEIPVKQDDGSQKTFAQLAENGFGKDSAKIKKLIDDTPFGIPQSAYDDVPDMGFDEELKTEEKKETATAAAAEIEELESRFSGTSEQELLDQLDGLKREVLSLQTDKAYYLDSFMDWIEAGIVPDSDKANSEDPRPEANNHLQHSYKNPEFVLTTAQHDFEETVRAYTQQAFGISQDYHALASAFASGDAALAVETLAEAEITPYAKRLKEWALESGEKHSFAQWALEGFETRDDQATVLNGAVRLGNPLEFDDATHAPEVFKKMLGLALDTENPMPVSTLLTALDTIKKQHGLDITIENVLGERPMNPENAIVKTVETWRGKPEKMAEVLGAILTGIERRRPQEVAEGYAVLLNAFDTNNGAMAAKAVEKLAQDKLLEPVMALAYVVEPKLSLTDLAWRDLDEPEAVYNALVQNGVAPVRPGLTEDHEFALLAGTVTGGLNDDYAQITQSMAETDFAWTLKRHGRDKVKQALLSECDLGSDEATVLEALLNGTADDEAKRARAFGMALQPFENDVVRANMFYKAAQKSGVDETKEELAGIAKTLSGFYLRYGDGGLLNPDQVANIWYDGNTLRYIANNSTAPANAPMDADMASEFLTNLAQHDNFMIVSDELLNRDKVEHIWYEGNALKFYAGGKHSMIECSPDEGLKTLKSLMAQDNFVEIGDHLLNTDTLSYVVYSDGQLYVLDYLDDIQVIEAPQEDADRVFAHLEKLDGYVRNGEQVLNTARASNLWYDEEQEQINFLIDGKLYGAADDNIPGLRLNEEDGNKLLAKIGKQKGFISFGDKVMNTDRISTITYSAEDGELQFNASGKLCAISMSEKDADGIVARAAKEDAFVSNGKMAVNAEDAANIWYTPESKENREGLSFLIEGETYVLPMGEKEAKKVLKDLEGGSRLPVGSELINIDRISDIWVQNDGGDKEMRFISGQNVCPIYLDKTANGEDLLDSIVAYGGHRVPENPEYAEAVAALKKGWQSYVAPRDDKMAPPRERGLDGLIETLGYDAANDDKPGAGVLAQFRKEIKDVTKPKRKLETREPKVAAKKLDEQKAKKANDNDGDDDDRGRGGQGGMGGSALSASFNEAANSRKPTQPRKRSPKGPGL